MAEIFFSNFFLLPIVNAFNVLYNVIVLERVQKKKGDCIMEYVIVHDVKGTDRFNGCLYRPCGNSKERADELLNQILNNPTEQDKVYMSKGYYNFRIDTVEDRDCWWNDPVLCN